MKRIDKSVENLSQKYIDDFIDFEKNLNGQAQSPIHRVRKAAIESFTKNGFPTRKMESWKYTDPSGKLARDYQRDTALAEVAIPDAENLLFKSAAENVACFINGKFSKDRSRLENLPDGVIVCDMQTAFEEHRELVKNYLFKQAQFAENSFVALNTAFVSDGIFIFVPEKTQLQTPLQILHINGHGAKSLHFHPRLLLIAEKSSEFFLLENFRGIDDAQYFKNTVSEIFLAANAKVNHIRYQAESQKALTTSNTFVHQERDSVYTDLNLDLGGELVRNEMNVNLDAENCESNLYGFYFAQNTQHIDNHTFMNHLKPLCNSNELYKGILNDSARSVFSGTILVAKDAQKTNAFQSNKNLLLSKKAEADSKPQLKIYADDVRCTHGATIGELDESALFYLQQRGIDREQANVMLRYAFASEVLEFVKNDNLRLELEETITNRLRENF